MRQDAFTGGVEPGGLWNKNDIRILLCYLLASVDAPLSGEDIEKIVQERSLANYFEVRDALAALEQLGNVARVAEGLYTVTQAGREIADSLDATLPLSVRDKALEAAFLLLGPGPGRTGKPGGDQEDGPGLPGDLPCLRRGDGADVHPPLCAGQGPGGDGQTQFPPGPRRGVPSAAVFPGWGKRAAAGLFRGMKREAAGSVPNFS